MPNALKEYDAKIDSKKRITLRGAQTEFYHVTEKKDGTIILSARVLAHPDEISEKSYKMLDQSIQNMKEGNVSEPIDMSDLD